MNGPNNLILIAEDDDNDYWFFEWAFNKVARGSSLRRVQDGREAMQYLSGEGKYADRQAHPLPRLLITDLSMPHADGFALLEWKRQKAHLPGLPMIVLTSSESPADMERAFSLGAHSYHVKPRQFDRFTALVQAIRDYWLEWNVTQLGQLQHVKRTPPPDGPRASAMVELGTRPQNDLPDNPTLATV
jgi:CheY-like chemotaxis protein